MNALSVSRRRRGARLCRRARRSRRRGACASSAMRQRASPRIICASCASSASTPPMATGRPMPPGLPPASPRAPGLEQLSRERVRMELLKLLLARHATPTLAVMAESGLLGAGARRRAATRGLREHGQGRGGGRRAGRTRCGGSARSACAIAEDAERLWQRLRLSNAEHERLASMGEGWWRISPRRRQAAARALLYRLGPERFVDRVLLAWARSRRGRARRALARARDAARALDRAGVSAARPPISSRAASARGPALGAALREAEAGLDRGRFPGATAARPSPAHRRERRRGRRSSAPTVTSRPAQAAGMAKHCGAERARHERYRAAVHARSSPADIARAESARAGRGARATPSAAKRSRCRARRRARRRARCSTAFPRPPT